MHLLLYTQEHTCLYSLSIDTQICPRLCSYQHGVLHIVTQQAGVIESVFSLLHLRIHWAFLYLMFNGTEEFIQRFSCGVLQI